MGEVIKRSKVTIGHVAKEAGVSTTTVSRYLNGKFEFMSDETRATIKKVIEKMDYRPSNVARSLKAQRSGVVGCIIADITNPFSAYIVKGISDVCIKNGYQVLFANTDNEPEREIECIKSLLDNQLDGLIINTSGYVDDYLINLHGQGVPIVMADRCLQDKFALDTITTENYNSTYESVEFLSSQGYDKVVFFTLKQEGNSTRKTRHEAYLDAVLKRYNVDGNKDTFTIDENDTDKCRAHLRWLKTEYPTSEIAILAVNGITLLNVLHAIQEEDMVIAKDFGICGFDDWEWASLIGPGITTISQDSYKTGVESAKLLLSRIEGKSIVQDKKEFREIPAKLTVRGSTILYKKQKQ